jgi:hypothetical protein
LKDVEAAIASLPNLRELDLRGVPIHDRAAILALKIDGLRMDEPEAPAKGEAEGGAPKPDR